METAFRRPSAVREALALALMLKHVWEYVRNTSHALDALIEERRTSPATTGLLPSAPPAESSAPTASSRASGGDA